MKTVLSLVRHLKRHLPPALPVIFRRRKLKGRFGEHWVKNGINWIVVDSRSSATVQIDTIVHEWAHALDESPCREPHRDSWGKWYSRVYREQLTWENL